MWRYFAANAVGASHIKTGQPCQDRFFCSSKIQDWLIVAVADGAGSAAHSARGAEVSCAAIVEAIAHSISESVPDIVEALRVSVIAARESVLREAEALSVPARELASTLLALAIGPSGGAAAQI